MSLIVMAALMAAESHEEPNELLSWGVGIGIILVLGAIMGALVGLGGGREHS